MDYLTSSPQQPLKRGTNIILKRGSQCSGYGRIDHSKQASSCVLNRLVNRRPGMGSLWRRLSKHLWLLSLSGSRELTDSPKNYQQSEEGPNEGCACTYQAPNVHHHDEELVVFVGNRQLHLPTHLSNRPGPRPICREKGS